MNTWELITTDPGKTHTPPTIFVPRQVLQAIIADSMEYLEPETGTPMVGLVLETQSRVAVTEPTIFVLGTIPAGFAVRTRASFELGGQLQGDVFDWLNRNWEERRKNSRGRKIKDFQFGQQFPEDDLPALYDYPLTDLGDWHKHPGGYGKPSGGDLATAIQTLQNPAFEAAFLIAPIVTVQSVKDEAVRWEGWTVVRVDPEYEVGITFYYLSKKMLQLEMRDFILVQPTVVYDKVLPSLPPLSWHLRDPNRFLMEMGLLKAYGCQVQVIYREMDGKPPLEVCFVISRPDYGWTNRLLIVTKVDYPENPPLVKVAKGTAQPSRKVRKHPHQLREWFDKLWRETQTKAPLPPLRSHAQDQGTFPWQPHCTLLQLVMDKEQRGELWEPTGTE